MLNTVCLNHFHLIPYFNREEHTIDCVALFYLFQYPRIPVCKRSSLVETFFYRFKKFIFIPSSHISFLFEELFLNTLRVAFFKSFYFSVEMDEVSKNSC